MIKYTVYYNDDRAEVISDTKLTGEELAERIGCDVEDLVQVELEDAD